MAARNTYIDTQKERIIDLYLTGTSRAKIARLYGVSDVLIAGRLQGWGVDYGRYLPVNHCAMELLNPATCYWIGYLAGDGCIEIVGDRPQRVVLLSNDLEQLEKFKAFTSSRNKISTNKHGGHAIKIGSPTMAQRLISLGITPRKSRTLSVTNTTLLGSIDFIRGVIDSDGTISENHYKNSRSHATINITSGSKEFSQQIQQALIKNWGADCRIYRNRTCYNVYVISRFVISLLVLLYATCSKSISLDRKRDKALCFIEKYGDRYE